MLIQRVRPKDTQGTMYHYCSAQTFLSIIQNRTIRFSDINLLNDAEEGRWGYGIFIEARNGTIVPFLDMPFEVSKEHQPIQEVVLGPRCPNDLAAIRFVLGNSGYGKRSLKECWKRISVARRLFAGWQGSFVGLGKALNALHNPVTLPVVCGRMLLRS
jgi:hypothetical protein